MRICARVQNSQGRHQAVLQTDDQGSLYQYPTKVERTRLKRQRRRVAVPGVSDLLLQ